VEADINYMVNAGRQFDAPARLIGSLAVGVPLRNACGAPPFTVVTDHDRKSF
jgi:hypothetical protein